MCRMYADVRCPRRESFVSILYMIFYIIGEPAGNFKDSFSTKPWTKARDIRPEPRCRPAYWFLMSGVYISVKIFPFGSGIIRETEQMEGGG